MRLAKVKEILNAEVLACENLLEREVLQACGADLMSDVLAFSKEKALLLTGLVNPQVIRTAEMMDIKGVVFLRGKKPTQGLLDLAEEKNIVVFASDSPMFRACGLLYAAGLGGDEAQS